MSVRFFPDWTERAPSIKRKRESGQKWEPGGKNQERKLKFVIYAPTASYLLFDSSPVPSWSSFCVCSPFSQKKAQTSLESSLKTMPPPFTSWDHEPWFRVFKGGSPCLRLLLGTWIGLCSPICLIIICAWKLPWKVWLADPRNPTWSWADCHRWLLPLATFSIFHF